MSSPTHTTPHLPPSKQPRSFPDIDEIKEMLKSEQCFVRFRESGSSDVWKLFEEVCFKQNNEFTGIIRCTKCQHMARYHGHITGTSHMRRHKCFGELFPESVKQQQLNSAAKKKAAGGDSSMLSTTSSAGGTPMKGRRGAPMKAEKRSICLENGGPNANDSTGPMTPAKRLNENDSANDSTNSLANIGATDGDSFNEKCVKLELRTYNNQTIIAPRAKNALASTVLTFCYSELVNLECVCSNSFKSILKGAAVKVSTPLVLNIHYLKLRAQELYNQEKANIIADITESIEKNIGGAIVSDFKDDLCIMSYSFIDSNWKLQDKVLRGATRIVNILDFISQTLGDYGLLKDTLINKFTYISNAGQLSGVNIHLSSVSHLLDTLIDAAVFSDGKHDQLFADCKYICSELKILPETLLSSWIYKYDVIRLVLENLDKFSPGNFSMDTMLPAMEMLRDLLAPFKEASLLMRSEVQETPSINQVALQYFKLQKVIIPNDDDSETLAEHKKKIQQALSDNFELHMMHKIAVFLWPNFRHLKMFNETERNEIYAEVRRMLDAHTEAAALTEQDTLEDSIKAQTQYSEWEAVTEFDQDEVSRYLLDKFNHCNEKTLLTWWKEASKRYPKLSNVARSILAIPASVTSIERRHRLHSRPPVDEELLFLHCNLATR